jgi:hypothetical protein
VGISWALPHGVRSGSLPQLIHPGTPSTPGGPFAVEGVTGGRLSAAQVGHVGDRNRRPVDGHIPDAAHHLAAARPGCPGGARICRASGFLEPPARVYRAGHRAVLAVRLETAPRQSRIFLQAEPAHHRVVRSSMGEKYVPERDVTAAGVPDRDPAGYLSSGATQPAGRQFHHRAANGPLQRAPICLLHLGYSVARLHRAGFRLSNQPVDLTADCDG